MIAPLGNRLAVLPLQEPSPSALLEVIQSPTVYRRARVLACGPEVRDVVPNVVAYVNLGAGLDTGREGIILVPESAVLGILRD